MCCRRQEVSHFLSFVVSEDCLTGKLVDSEGNSLAPWACTLNTLAKALLVRNTVRLFIEHPETWTLSMSLTTELY
jgi:hypothetical protein